jgi:hypothetical protein
MRPSALAIPALAALAATVACTAPAAASVDPSISVSPKRLTLGDTATIRGTSWVVGAGCSDRVRFTIQGRADGERWSAPIATRRVRPATASFPAIRFTPPQSKFPAGRATIVATQSCPEDQGGRYRRTARITLVD